MEFKAKIKDPIGLHARPASLITQVANKFKAEVTISSNGKNANLKSIMSVMALGVKNNEEVTISAKGTDAEKAIKEIEKTMKDNKLI